MFVGAGIEPLNDIAQSLFSGPWRMRATQVSSWWQQMTALEKPVRNG